ncbi:MAG: Gfo/Idh/MocA family oxidoreductase [Firmicutes bacterium]|nr:Gfo/Idh/MocA family oxidoreductase [Bacillota bacterium]
MSTSMGIGVIGLGTMGTIHANNLATSIFGAGLVAVADPDPHRAEQVSLPEGAVHRFSDYRALLDAKGVDAVVVASSSTTHAEILQEVLMRHLPVLCEKPLAPSLQESVGVHEAFHRAGVPLQLGFMRRFDPAYVRAFEAIQAGVIGTVYHYSGISRDQFAPPLAVAQHSGGFFADTGVHEFDLARWLMGQEIVEVFVRGGVFVSDAYRDLGDVDQAHVSFGMDAGGLGLIELTRNAMYGYDIRTEILGSRGAIRIGVQPETGMTLLTETGVTGDHVLSYRDRFREAYREELQAFVRCLHQGLPVLVNSLDGIRTVAVAEAAKQSLAEGRSVEVTYDA